MRKIAMLAAAGMLAVSVGACGPAADLVAAVSNDTGGGSTAVTVNDLAAGAAAYSPKVAAVVSKVSSGLAATAADKDTVCKAVAALTPTGTELASAPKDVQAGVAGAQALCDGSTATIGDAVLTAINAWNAVQAILHPAGK